MELSDWDFDAVADRNRQNLKDLDDGGTLEVWAARKWILIGPGHPQEYYDLVNDPEATVNHGSVVIEKGGILDPGSLTFSGIPGGRGELEEHIADFSKKKVLYS
jgi:hypothetical protein